MAKYSIQISKTAQKELDKLSDKLAEPILHAIADLAFDPRPHGYKKLKGLNGYRIRSGDYRIIYEIKDSLLIVKVINVGHRKDVYE
jgi:mRNA interferase RelE/StbE